MESAVDHETVCKDFSDQKDAFVLKMDWPSRSKDEKTNNLAYPSKDTFLKGVQAVLELYYYGIPLSTVFSCPFNSACLLFMRVVFCPSLSCMASKYC
jgi:hypothetical protein